MDTVKAVAFLAIGSLMIVSGVVYFRRADEYARMMSQHLAAARPCSTALDATAFYSHRMFFWQLRLSGGGVTLIGAFFIVAAVVGLLQRH